MSRVVEKSFNDRKEKNKEDRFKRWFFFPFLVQRRVLSFANGLWTEIGSKATEIRGRQSPSRIRGMNGERKRDFWRSTVCVIDEIKKILRHVTIRTNYFDFGKFFLLLFSLFLFTFIPHRTKFPASSKQRSDTCQMQISRRAIGPAGRDEDNNEFMRRGRISSERYTGKRCKSR